MKIFTITKLFRQTDARKIRAFCDSMNCKGVECHGCPFETVDSVKALIKELENQ